MDGVSIRFSSFKIDFDKSVCPRLFNIFVICEPIVDPMDFVAPMIPKQRCSEGSVGISMST